MSAANGSALKEDISATTVAVDGKGKGKAPAEAHAHDEGMDVDESSSEEEIDETEPVADEPDEDNMEEIDLDNIIGRRTRGRNIDFAKAAEELPEDDEDEDEDDDFEAPEEDEEMKD
ncbi:hypothetical protein L207DRAFT_46742 [Hyaloscypha variabilis F]|uniref:Histone chaperone domain-containing protein n=1 Tax=Hyaloscypha variabilis (strain UAMH 11265 / GT02V1 / F) TaxID=1149755 RepID=A0A2J6RK65_HYAVF|nr:hypothetical protein L207DRAFT_46742 [Hyaloscypha variabilis F]